MYGGDSGNQVEMEQWEGAQSTLHTIDEENLLPDKNGVHTSTSVWSSIARAHSTLACLVIHRPRAHTHAAFPGTVVKRRGPASVGMAGLDVGKEIGRGQFGIVFKGTWQHEGVEKPVAIKQLVVPKRDLDLFSKITADFKDEARGRNRDRMRLSSARQGVRAAWRALGFFYLPCLAAARLARHCAVGVTRGRWTSWPSSAAPSTTETL